MIKDKFKQFRTKIKTKYTNSRDKIKRKYISYKEGIKENFKFYKQEFKNSLKDMKHIKTFNRQIPNILTFIRLIGAIPAGLMFYFGNPYIALGLIAFLWGTDAIDGPIARKFNIQSKLGADMDAIADKAMFLGSAIPLITTAPILLVTFLLEGVISAINVSGRAEGLDTKTVKSGKKKTIALALTLIAGYLVKFLSLPTIILSALTAATGVYQIIAIKDYIKEYKKMSKEKTEGTDTNKEELELEKEEPEEEKELTKEKDRNLKSKLIKLKEFLLSTKEPDKLDKPKTKTKKKNK